MTDRKFTWAATLLLAATLVVGLAGCKKKEAAKPAPTAADALKDATKVAEDVVEAVEAGFANIRCPIMTKNKIDPKKVDASLIREFKGQKVAFCCGGCPPAWDKLSDEDKVTKLAAAAK